MTGLEDFEALAVASSDVVLQPVPLPIPQRLRTPVSALADERLFERTVPYAAASEVNGPNANAAKGIHVARGLGWLCVRGRDSPSRAPARSLALHYVG